MMNLFSLPTPDIDVLRPLEWIAPPKPVSREVLHVSADSDAGDGAGSPPPLLFVHGASMGAWAWREYWMPEAASRGYDTYAVSLRGHGRSDGHRRRNRWMMRDYVHDVLQTIVELPAPPVLIGHSMGSVVVERVAARYPAAAAVLMAPAGDRNGLRAAARIALRHPTDVLKSLVGQSIPPRHEYLFSRHTDRHQTRSKRAQTRAPTALNQYELLAPKRRPAVQCPLIVVGMECDALVSAGTVESFARRRNTEAIIIPRAGHTPHLEPQFWRPALDIVLAAVESTLDQVVNCSR